MEKKSLENVLPTILLINVYPSLVCNWIATLEDFEVRLLFVGVQLCMLFRMTLKFLVKDLKYYYVCFIAPATEH